MTLHHLGPAPELVTDAFDPGRAPVLTVGPATSWVVHTLDAAGHLRRQEFPGHPVERLLPPRSPGTASPADRRPRGPAR